MGSVLNGQTLVRDSDAELIDRLRHGDEAAFVWLIDTYSAPLLRLAVTFVQDGAVAEEVVQETWLAVVRGIGRFEARSSVKMAASRRAPRSRPGSSRSSRTRRRPARCARGERYHSRPSSLMKVMSPPSTPTGSCRRVIRNGHITGRHRHSRGRWGPKAPRWIARRWQSFDARSRTCREPRGWSSLCATSTDGRRRMCARRSI